MLTYSNPTGRLFGDTGAVDRRYLPTGTFKYIFIIYVGIYFRIIT